MRPVRLVLLLSLLAPALGAQASAVNFGRGCDLPGNPPPLIRATGLPQLGASFTVRYTGPNGRTPVSEDRPVLLTGFATITWPIPPISSLQPANCQLLVAPAFSVAMAWNGARFDDQLTVQIPNSASLIGATYHQQFAGFYSRCQPTCVLQMLRMSDGLSITLGV